MKNYRFFRVLVGVSMNLYTKYKYILIMNGYNIPSYLVLSLLPQMFVFYIHHTPFIWTTNSSLEKILPSYNKHFVFFTVPPVCRPKGVKVYGVAKMETAHIACNVEANPHEVSFRWVLNTYFFPQNLVAPHFFKKCMLYFLEMYFFFSYYNIQA